jgi:hypothetical protein
VHVFRTSHEKIARFPGMRGLRNLSQAREDGKDGIADFRSYI